MDEQPDEPKTLLELKIRRAADTGAQNATAESNQQDAAMGSGAAAGAGVLTAADEDEEGGEEADLPAEFDYYSDGEGEEDKS